MKVARGDLRNCGICGERGRRLSLFRRRALAFAQCMWCSRLCFLAARIAAAASADAAATVPRSFIGGAAARVAAAGVGVAGVGGAAAPPAAAATAVCFGSACGAGIVFVFCGACGGDTAAATAESFIVFLFFLPAPPPETTCGYCRHLGEDSDESDMQRLPQLRTPR